MTVADIQEYIKKQVEKYDEIPDEYQDAKFKQAIADLVIVLGMLDELGSTMSRHSATFLTCRIIDELDVPSSVAEKIEQKLMSGKFEEVEKYYVERKKWLAENRAL